MEGARLTAACLTAAYLTAGLCACLTARPKRRGRSSKVRKRWPNKSMPVPQLLAAIGVTAAHPCLAHAHLLQLLLAAAAVLFQYLCHGGRSFGCILRLTLRVKQAQREQGRLVCSAAAPCSSVQAHPCRQKGASLGGKKEPPLWARGNCLPPPLAQAAFILTSPH